ncbi:hypothetical protein ACF1BQ_031935 [Bradyrhizobium sp. RDT10]
MPVGDHALLQQSVDLVRKIAEIDGLLREDDSYGDRFILEMTLQEPGHPEGPDSPAILGLAAEKLEARVSGSIFVTSATEETAAVANVTMTGSRTLAD